MRPSDSLEYYGSYVECPSLLYGDCEQIEYIEGGTGIFQKVANNSGRQLKLEFSSKKQ